MRAQQAEAAAQREEHTLNMTSLQETQNRQRSQLEQRLQEETEMARRAAEADAATKAAQALVQQQERHSTATEAHIQALLAHEQQLADVVRQSTHQTVESQAAVALALSQIAEALAALRQTAPAALGVVTSVSRPGPDNTSAVSFTHGDQRDVPTATATSVAFEATTTEESDAALQALLAAEDARQHQEHELLVQQEKASLQRINAEKAAMQQRLQSSTGASDQAFVRARLGALAAQEQECVALFASRHRLVDAESTQRRLRATQEHELMLRDSHHHLLLYSSHSRLLEQAGDAVLARSQGPGSGLGASGLQQPSDLLASATEVSRRSQQHMREHLEAKAQRLQQHHEVMSQLLAERDALAARAEELDRTERQLASMARLVVQPSVRGQTSLHLPPALSPYQPPKSRTDDQDETYGYEESFEAATEDARSGDDDVADAVEENAGAESIASDIVVEEESALAADSDIVEEESNAEAADTEVGTDQTLSFADPSQTPSSAGRAVGAASRAVERAAQSRSPSPFDLRQSLRHQEQVASTAALTGSPASVSAALTKTALHHSVGQPLNLVDLTVPDDREERLLLAEIAHLQEIVQEKNAQVQRLAEQQRQQRRLAFERQRAELQANVLALDARLAQVSSDSIVDAALAGSLEPARSNQVSVGDRPQSSTVTAAASAAAWPSQAARKSPAPASTAEEDVYASDFEPMTETSAASSPQGSKHGGRAGFEKPPQPAAASTQAVEKPGRKVEERDAKESGAEEEEEDVEVEGDLIEEEVVEEEEDVVVTGDGESQQSLPASTYESPTAAWVADHGRKVEGHPPELLRRQGHDADSEVPLRPQSHMDSAPPAPSVDRARSPPSAPESFLHPSAAVQAGSSPGQLVDELFGRLVDEAIDDMLRVRSTVSPADSGAVPIISLPLTLSPGFANEASLRSPASAGPESPLTPNYHTLRPFSPLQQASRSPPSRENTNRVALPIEAASATPERTNSPHSASHRPAHSPTHEQTVERLQTERVPAVPSSPPPLTRAASSLDFPEAGGRDAAIVHAVIQVGSRREEADREGNFLRSI